MSDVKELSINGTTYDIKSKTVVDKNSGSVAFWTGTQDEYNAITTHDPKTQYTTTDTNKIYLGDQEVVSTGANKDLSNLSTTGESHFIKPTDKATASSLGIVKPDGTSVTVDSNGVLSATTQPGTPLNPTTYKKILKDTVNGKVKLMWTDPDDTVVGGATLAEWAYTSIVKKQGGYPANITDGTLVIKNETKNQYANAYYEDTQASPEDWYYKAFPVSAQEVVGLSQKNKFLQTGIFGFAIDDDDPVPSTRVSYLEDCDNAEYKKCYMDFANDKFEGGFWEDTWLMSNIKPCALKYDGTVDYYLSKSNFNYKEDGLTASDVSDTSYAGNFMVEFPCVYMKRVDEGSLHKVYLSQTKIDSSYDCWYCKKSDGTYSNAFYFAMFEGTVISSVMRSIATSGKPTANTTAEQEATYATANGTNWNTTTWADEDYLQMLFPMFFKSTDSQGTLGAGATTSTTALTVNNNAALAKGWMYGTSSYSSYGMTFLGIHNFYGHRWRRCNGLMNDNGTIKVKMTPSTIDGSTVTGYNRTGSGYINTGYSFPAASANYIKKLGSLGSNFGLVPKDVSGSSTTYYCDGCWSNNGQLNQLLLGGAVYHSALCGCFAFIVDDLPSHSGWVRGASVSYHPL